MIGSSKYLLGSNKYQLYMVEFKKGIILQFLSDNIHV